MTHNIASIQPPQRRPWADTPGGEQLEHWQSKSIAWGDAVVPYGPCVTRTATGSRSAQYGWHFPGRRWFTQDENKALQWARAIDHCMTQLKTGKAA